MALRLNWPAERYARIYCRDTIDWDSLSWDAQALWCQLNRKADRRGFIDLGRTGRKGVAALLKRTELWPRLDPALAELEADGCVRIEGSLLVIEAFVEAQEAVSSGAARQRKYRERQAAEAAEAGRESMPTSPAEDSNTPCPTSATPGDATSRTTDGMSPGDDLSPDVTRGYGTAWHGTAGTEQHRIHAVLRATDDGRPLTGEALSDAFAADLEAEATVTDAQRARVLSTLGTIWRTCVDVAGDLRRAPKTVEADLYWLKHSGLVEHEELGSPPVKHWRRTIPDRTRSAVGGA